MAICFTKCELYPRRLLPVDHPLFYAPPQQLFETACQPLTDPGRPAEDDKGENPLRQTVLLLEKSPTMDLDSLYTIENGCMDLAPKKNRYSDFIVSVLKENKYSPL